MNALFASKAKSRVARNDKRPRLRRTQVNGNDEDGVWWDGFAAGEAGLLHQLHLLHLLHPSLQRIQLLGVFKAGLVVGGNGCGNGRERKAWGGRISICGGFG